MKNETYTPDTNGLYNKYTVVRQDGTPVEEPTFTLRPQDPHARIAMLAYAQSVQKQNGQLAKDLRSLASSYAEYPKAEVGEWVDAYTMEGMQTAIDNAREDAWAQFTKNPIPVYDQSGEVIVAYVKNEYEPGTPDVRYLPNGDPGYPGYPGYNYWRFLSIDEIKALPGVKP